MATADWSRKTSDVPERLRRQWRADRALRPAMRSPGRPDPSRAVQRQFWRTIATGVTTAEASLAVGVSVPVGTRWFRHAGGMPPISLAEPTGRYLSFEEREEIAIMRAKDKGVREIARALGRDPGTISRELRRNAATRGGTQEYRATVAQWKAQQVAKRPKVARLIVNDRLREYVQERLDGSVKRADGTVVAGPVTADWKGRNKPHRQDRRWATAWSPEHVDLAAGVCASPVGDVVCGSRAEGEGAACRDAGHAGDGAGGAGRLDGVDHLVQGERGQVASGAAARRPGGPARVGGRGRGAV